MRLNDIRLGLSNIVADPSMGNNIVQVVAARLDTDKEQHITGVRLTVLTRRYSQSAAKLPYSENNKLLYEQLQEKLKKDDMATVILVNPVIVPYALIANGNLLSGVSIKADTFKWPDDDEPLDI